MGKQRIIVTRGFMGWPERSRKMSVNVRKSREANRRTETSVQFLRSAEDCVCVVGTVDLVEFKPAIHSQRRNWITEKLTMGTGLIQNS
ncbi:hypothetical protein AVEN_108969-1 [Araneus ventricosus]|uniref:Uncharacterized protein n=1 Tax=Araneus ventricosus TaxID=182803 RepID=A0A4Y2F2Y6_ARAVE|nr:hypothetical protein AVEN_108969-1 [Araneus ventricosus]